MERLQKYLAKSGVASRRSAERLIADGRVRVNGKIVQLMGTSVDPDRDRVVVDGQAVKPETRLEYVLLNKPVGVVSTAFDPEGRRTVVDLVNSAARLFPVGRLDYDTEGLLLLTNDGDLALRLTHPRYGIEKEYRVFVDSEPRVCDLQRLRDGLMLGSVRTAPAQVSVVRSDPSGTWLALVLHEGRNRQVRRMIEAVGMQVLRLVRVRVGPLTLGDLAVGASRRLDPREVSILRERLR